MNLGMKERNMRHLRRITALVVAVTVLFALPAAKTFAYGASDHTLAQVEFSGNCDNPSFWFCAPPPAGVGVGGIWLWIDIGAANTADFSGALCDHVGAQPLLGTGTWTYSTGVPVGVKAPFHDPSNQYYVVTLYPYLRFAFPVTQDHYAWNPAPGVSVQLTVAP
jgi:hypothetical protein